MTRSRRHATIRIPGQEIPMRLVTYSVGPAGPARTGVRVGHRILDVEMASRVKGEPLPATMKALLAGGRGALSRVQSLAKAATSAAGAFSHALLEERAVRLLPPVPEGALAGHDARVAPPAGGARRLGVARGAVVVGRRAQAVAVDDALDCVAGVTLLGDLSGGGAREGGADPPSPFAMARRMPGLGALGPEIVTMDEIAHPDELWVTCAVNGEERFRASTRGPVERLPGILAHCSREAPLEPGDLFLGGDAAAGEPGEAALRLQPGDVVECSIEGIATLRATIVAPGG
jgi:2-keto-4-pentenoate hydratase/2-oxohepta-3-ene-1,7-dioic acid hydratase in catechol pathway